MLLLKTIGLGNLLQHCMFWHNSDEAELAITEHAELDGRLIQFNREENRLRALCTSSKARIILIFMSAHKNCDSSTHKQKE